MISNSLQVLLTVHFFTFLLAELVLIAPFAGWLIRHFLPARAHLTRSDFVLFLERASKRAIDKGLAIPEALACIHLVNDGYATGKYRSMTELRNAALVRMMATMMGTAVHSVSVFAL